MPTPLISIITVTRNDRAGLAATRASLGMQSWQGFEWRVADGGSTDDSLAALHGPGRQPDLLDSRPDGGPFAGMDRAMAGAAGDYLLFLNGGDCLAGPAVLAQLLPALAMAPDLVYGDALEDPGDGQVRVKPSRHWRWCFYGMPAHHCAILYRRDLLTGLRFDCGYRIAGDYAVTAAALARARTCRRLPMVIASFAAGGLSRREAALGRQEQDRIRREVLRLGAPLSSAIRVLHIVAAWVRQRSPGLYAVARFRIGTGRG